MSDHDLASHLLGNAGEDSGCDGALARLAEYVEGELTGHDMARILPAITEHLRNCPACAEDYQGLFALARKRRGV
jgi:predicted anti-sigma-YlaC factor YlaD